MAQVSLLLLLAVAAGQAFKLEDAAHVGKRAENGCPAVWNTISKDLSTSFLSGGQCNDLARQSVRYAFHDAATYSQSLPRVEPASGGADGSLLLSGEEIQRDENNGLETYHSFIKGKFAQYKNKGIGAADLVQFAGSVGTLSCPGGITVRTVIGRKDSSRPAPEGLLPKAFGPGSDHDTLYKLFLDKGISASELAALIGAHSISIADAQPELPPRTPQDTTPAKWDVTYYSNVYKPPKNIGRFESDINLSKPNTAVGRVFQTFVGNQGKWNAQFAPAMSHLGLLGVEDTNYGGFVDCTAALPPPRALRKRAATTGG